MICVEKAKSVPQREQLRVGGSSFSGLNLFVAVKVVGAAAAAAERDAISEIEEPPTADLSEARILKEKMVDGRR
jgi:hypothetical protein